MPSKGKKFKIVSPPIIFLILLGFIFLFGLISLVKDYWLLKRSGALRPVEPLFYLLKQPPRPGEKLHSLSFRDIDRIEIWMTFDYLNKQLDIPSDYLAKALFVNDKNYPNISLARTAKKKGIKSAQFLEEVKRAIHEYFILNDVRS